MPESRDQACSVIGKFTQGSKADGKRLTRRLVTDRGELDYLVRDTRLSGTLVGAPMKCELGHILTYYDGSQPQFAHLRASMLAYAHINLLSMLSRFEPDEAVRVATDSIYVKKTALCKLEGVGAYKPHAVHPKGIAASVSPATTRQPRGHHEMGLPQPSGVTRARASSCRWNTQPTSLSLNTKQQKRTSLAAPRRATTIP